MLVMALKFEVIPYFRAEVFKVSVIPYHANLVDEYDGVFRERYVSYLVNVKEISPGDVNC